MQTKRKLDALEKLFFQNQCNMYLVMKLKDDSELQRFTEFTKANLIQLRIKGVDGEFIEYQGDKVNENLIVYHKDESHDADYYQINNLGDIIYVATDFLAQVHLYPKDHMAVTIVNHSTSDSKFMMGFYTAFHKNERMVQQMPESTEEYFKEQIKQFKEKVMDVEAEDAKHTKIHLKNSYELMPIDQPNCKYNYLLTVQKINMLEHSYLKSRFTQRHIIANAIGSLYYYLKTGQMTKEQLQERLEEGIYCKTNYIVDSRQFVKPEDLKTRVFGNLVSSSNAIYSLKGTVKVSQLIEQLTENIMEDKANNEWCRFFPTFNDTMKGNPPPPNNHVLNTIQLSSVGLFNPQFGPAWFGAFNNTNNFPQIHCCVTYTNKDDLIISYCHAGNDDMVTLGQEIGALIKKALIMIKDDITVGEIVRALL